MEFGSDGITASRFEVDLLALDGLVKALSRFSLSSVVITPGCDVSSGFTRFFLGVKITAGLTEGSRTVGTAALRCCSTSMRGAVLIVPLVVARLDFISMGAKIPGRLAGFWKCPIALASFRN